MNEAKLPSVQVLDSIKPDVANSTDDRLAYANLGPAASKYRLDEYRRLDKAWQTTDILAVEAAAREAANQYLVMTANRLQEVPSGEKALLLSERFTQASVELFGAPKAEEAAPLLAGQYVELDDLEASDNVDQDKIAFLRRTYERVLGDVSVGSVEGNIEKYEKVRQAAEKIGEVIMERFPEVMGVFEGDDDQIVPASEIADRFERALQILKRNDEAWEGWSIERTDDTKLIAKAPNSKVIVGQLRVPATLKELRGLFAHEVFRHSFTAVNGRRRGDEEAAKGLPGYLDAEEGAGVFFEYAVTGVIPPKNIDRYVDVALALGTLDGKPMTRQQLYEFAFTRGVVREQAKSGQNINMDDIAKRTREHVDRIYRGSRGDEHIGVFTKDIAYHKGFLEVADFVVRRLDEGDTPDEIFEYLTCGKFDPNNPLHVAYMKQSLAVPKQE